MKSFYSIVRYVSNQWSNENIAVGLLAVSGKKVFFQLSDRKLKLTQKLNPAAQRLLKFSLSQFEQFVEKEQDALVEKAQASLLAQSSKIDLAFAKQLHAYNTGILQFSVPELIDREFDQKSFGKYFVKIIDAQVPKKNEVQESEFVRRIADKLYKPLEDKVDVNYTLQKQALPTLYFDYHLDNIGVNGAIIASSSIDLNNERIDVLQKKLAEYESVVERLKSFGERNQLSSEHVFYLIADSYKGTTASNMELDGLLEGGLGKFQRVSTFELDKIVQRVEEKNATKFSSLLAEVI
ncbi:hypothetical protein [Cesiribacter andamanensis]|uniref:DUF3037 domain-containing protein n=1 Tax=Cesiribacter andamanensis AMV16 TaxID=1279009 RepID=M7NAB9_9BACT|nr:hypothetical protein [Cesiribacter andamanensis]EMR04146.1 hypothetical protein ADICEAN_00670 [Cesiribacter andamanensis AMV16]